MGSEGGFDVPRGCRQQHVTGSVFQKCRKCRVSRRTSCRRGLFEVPVTTPAWPNFGGCSAVKLVTGWLFEVRSEPYRRCNYAASENAAHFIALSSMGHANVASIPDAIRWITSQPCRLIPRRATSLDALC